MLYFLPIDSVEEAYFHHEMIASPIKKLGYLLKKNSDNLIFIFIPSYPDNTSKEVKVNFLQGLKTTIQLLRNEDKKDGFPFFPISPFGFSNS